MEQRSTVIKYIGLIVALFFGWQLSYSQCSVNITGNLEMCVGGTTELDAGAGYNTYAWSSGASNGQTIIVNTPGVYKVTVTDGLGCTAVDSVEVTYAPIIEPTLSATKLFACVGDEIQLSAIGAGPGGSYTWDNGLGNGQVQNVIINSTTDYCVELTDAHSCTATACITITSIEVPTLVVDPVAPVVCKGESVNVSVNGASQYSWFPSYGLSSTTGSVVIASPDVSTDYIITGKNSLGGTECVSTAQVRVVVDEFDITLPLAETLCKGEEHSVIANVSGGVAPYTYTWMVNNTLSTEMSLSITETMDETKLFQITGIDGNGCEITKSTTVNVYPDLVFEPYVNKTQVCPGDPVLFNASISGGTGEPYEFIFDGYYNNTILTIYPKETHMYKFIARDGCQEVKDSIEIETYPIPFLDFVADDYAGCMPKEIKFTSVSVPQDLIASFVWNFGDNDNNNLSIASSPSHTYDNKGEYDVTMSITTINGCNADTTKENLIHVEPKPVLEFSPQPATASFIKPIIYFKNNSVNVDSLDYIWSFGNGELSNIQSPEYTYDATGVYEVEMIGFTKYGCSDTIYRYVEIVPEVKFYVPEAFSPNGDDINDTFLPKGENIVNRSYVMKIYNRWGEIVFETTNLYEPWKGDIKGNGLAKPGTYAYYIEYKDIFDVNYKSEGLLQLIR
jgi:gliding motility-associated-like protein